MHPKIREIIDTTYYCQATIQEAGQYLPDDDAEFDRWMGEAVSNHDAEVFLYLVAAGLDRGRSVNSRHLERGLQLVPDPFIACCLAWNSQGNDLPAQVLKAIHHGGIRPEVHAGLLCTVVEWCREREQNVAMAALWSRGKMIFLP